MCSAQVSVRSNDISHGTTTGIVSPLTHILLIKFYTKHSLEFQDTVNRKYISTCDARSAICMEELHAATEMQNRLHRIFYTLSKDVLLAPVHHRRSPPPPNFRLGKWLDNSIIPWQIVTPIAVNLAYCSRLCAGCLLLYRMSQPSDT